jgi:hypothetical protein
LLPSNANNRIFVADNKGTKTDRASESSAAQSALLSKGTLSDINILCHLISVVTVTEGFSSSVA